MRYRTLYIGLGIAIMASQVLLAIEYPAYNNFWPALIFMTIFGLGFSSFLYGIIKGKDYGVSPGIAFGGAGGIWRKIRYDRINGTRTWKSDRDILSDIPSAVKSPDGKTVEYSNIFIKKPIGSNKHSHLLNEAAQKYINGELDDEGFYSYVGKHTWREEQMLDVVKKFKR